MQTARARSPGGFLWSGWTLVARVTIVVWPTDVLSANYAPQRVTHQALPAHGTITTTVTVYTNTPTDSTSSAAPTCIISRTMAARELLALTMAAGL